MLSVRYRLKSSKDIKSAIRGGHAIRGNFLILKVMPNSRAQSRFAFVVGAKIGKKAVERNKIKRRLRGIIARHVRAIKGGFDCVVFATPLCKDRSAGDVENELVMLLQKIGML